MDALIGTAERYAQALTEMAVEQGELEAVTHDLELARRVFTERELVAFMGNPAAPAKAKMELLDELFGGKASATLTVFLKVIVTRRRERLMPGIIQAARHQCLARQGFQIVQVTTPYTMDDGLRSAVRDRLEAALGRKLHLECFVNKNLIGGIVIRHGDELIDASILGMLRRLREMLET